MDRYLSSDLFTASFSADNTLTRVSYQRTSARQVGFQEEWLQQAIAENPELVLAPCRASGLIEEEEQWTFWKREVPVGEAGNIDVLLVSDTGRVAIVETKLAYNPGARREVVAQVLEYATHLPSSSLDDLLPLPKGKNGQDFAHRDAIRERLFEGDYLLIIAGDQLDPRAVKLSRVLLGGHLVHPWDLALVDIAVFQREAENGKKEHLLVPHLRGVLVAEQRQVVHVKIEGDRTRLTVEQIAPSAGRSKWNEEQFFKAAESAQATLRDFARELQHLSQECQGRLTFDFGTSKDGSLILKKDGSNILEFYLGYRGYVRFRRKNEAGEDNFVKAFGEKWGQYYRTELEKRFPRTQEMGYPVANFGADHAEAVLPLLKEVLQGSVSDEAPPQTASAA